MSPTPSQLRIFKAVAGAVRNAAESHPSWNIDRRFEHSIAKRAAGTLTAGWPDVLAARSVSSDEARDSTRTYPASCPVKLRRPGKRGSSGFQRRSPLKILWQQIAMQMKGVKASGDMARAAALIDVLKMIAELQRAEAVPVQQRSAEDNGRTP